MDKTRLNHVKGMLTEILLTEIGGAGEKGMHGYALISRIRSRLQVYLGPSTIYPALVALEKSGLVESAWSFSSKRPIKAYKLTVKGRAEREALGQDLKFVLRAEAIV
jgi:DNA-binding PadR family transcriptional regulator